MLLAWLTTHGLSLLETAGIVGGLIFNAHSLRSGAMARRFQSLITITERHFQIWRQFSEQPQLRRVLDSNPDLTARPLTGAEIQFVGSLIFHLNLTFHGIENGLLDPPDGLSSDIRQFFSKPIPRQVWDESKALLDRRFVAFVEAQL